MEDLRPGLLGGLAGCSLDIGSFLALPGEIGTKPSVRFEGGSATRTLVGPTPAVASASTGGTYACGCYYRIYGGSGDDVIQVDDDTFRRIDGGLGNDTLVLGPGVTGLRLDGRNRRRIQSIECIQLSGHTLTVSKQRRVVKLFVASTIATQIPPTLFDGPLAVTELRALGTTVATIRGVDPDDSGGFSFTTPTKPRVTRVMQARASEVGAEVLRHQVRGPRTAGRRRRTTRRRAATRRSSTPAFPGRSRRR